MTLTLQRRNDFKHYIEEDDFMYYTEQNVFKHYIGRSRL
jgi:hypothetical protein